MHQLKKQGKAFMLTYETAHESLKTIKIQGINCCLVMLQDRVISFSGWVLGLQSVEAKVVDKRHSARYITKDRFECERVDII